MNDFLDRLIDRTLSTQPEIRPRTAPRFAGSQIEFEQQQTYAERWKPPGTTRMERHADQPSQGDHSNGPDPGADASSRASGQPFAASPPDRQTPANRSRGIVVRGAFDRPAVQPEYEEPDAARSPESAMSPRDVAVLASTEPALPNQSGQPPVALFTPIQIVTGSAQSLQLEEPSHRAADIRRLNHQRTSVPQPDRLSNGVSEPAIRVTIGRVDIRAVLPDAPAPRTERRPEPQLTLDEYIKQRNEGKR